jgi:FAD/FMN-containing dehydrogenase
MIPRLTDTPMPAPLYGEFLTELRARGFEGDLSPAYADRTVLATDNSIYQLMPQAVAFPRTADDLVRIARLLEDPRFGSVTIAPRGGGTGTNGQLIFTRSDGHRC